MVQQSGREALRTGISPPYNLCGYSSPIQLKYINCLPKIILKKIWEKLDDALTFAMQKLTSLLVLVNFVWLFRFLLLLVLIFTIQ
jgi:hypothetical protein